MNPQLQAAFDQSLSGVPDWVADLRREGLDRFSEQAMPTQKMEHWKYVDLDFDLDELAVAVEPGTPLPPGPYVDALGEVEVEVDVLPVLHLLRRHRLFGVPVEALPTKCGDPVGDPCEGLVESGLELWVHVAVSPVIVAEIVIRLWR